MGPRRKLAEKWIRAFRTWRAVNPQSLIVACAVLASLTIQLAVPFFADTPCGLIIPHEHILIGGADEHDLAAHEAAEAACAAGRPAPPDQQASDLHGSKGRIINVIHLDQNATTHLLNIDILLASLPISITFQQPQGLSFSLDPLYSLSQSVAIPPPKPPPEAA